MFLTLFSIAIPALFAHLTDVEFMCSVEKKLRIQRIGESFCIGNAQLSRHMKAVCPLSATMMI